MNPIKNLFNSVSEMKYNNHNLNQGHKFLTNKQYFMKKPRFNKIIEGLTDESTLTAKMGDLKTVEDKITKLEQEDKNIFEKKAKNIIDKNSKIYYKNANDDYYKYENILGVNTFKPNHINFNPSCPKTQPIYQETVKSTNILGKIDPTSNTGDNKCIKFKTPRLQDLYIKKVTLEREIRELKGRKRLEETKDKNTITQLKNLESIKLSNIINQYNELTEKNKKIKDDVNSFDTSRHEFIKSITALQIQYGVIGITSIGMLYLMIKLMTSRND
jgi:hypothetical protein